MRAKLILTFLILLAFGGAVTIMLLARRPTVVATPPGAPRIAALSPAISVILRDLNVSHLVVARHKFDMVLDPSVPVALDDQIDYEQLLASRPTHVLLQLQSSALPPRLSQMASTSNWRIVDFPILALNDIRMATIRLAEMFAPGADQPLLASMDRAWAPRDGVFTGRVLLLAALDPPSALGPGSWHHQILDRRGGTPAITEGSPYITLDAEDVLAMKPDAILLILPRDRNAPPASPTAAELRDLLGRIGTLDIPAVTNLRLALIDNPLAHTPSTAMIGLADEIAAVLTRWNQDPALPR